MIMVRLRFNLSDAGARNALGPRLGLVALGEDFFVPADGVQHGGVVPISHQAPNLHEREAQLRAQAVAGLVAKIDERHLAAGAAKGRHGHFVLVGHLIQDPARGRLSGRLSGLGGGLNCNGDWRRTIKRVGVGAGRGLWVNEPDGGLFLGGLVQTGPDGLVVCVEFFKRHHFVPPVR